MRSLPCLLAPLLGLAACGYSEDRYVEESTAAACTLAVRCTDWYADADACVAASAPDPLETATCTYDPEAARSCVEAIDALRCPDEQGFLPDLPDACEAVYTDCD